MDERPLSPTKREWVITQTEFDRLLQQLDPDREQAGQKYEHIRQKLTNFFRWRGCIPPEECVDLTMDRVARRIGEGTELYGRDPYPYFHGVAVNVLREHWKRVEKYDFTALDELPTSQSPVENPETQRKEQSARLEVEVRLECLNRCVESLPRHQLEIVTEYHREQGHAKITLRNELARRMKIPLNALRIRVFRIREGLEECITACVNNK